MSAKPNPDQDDLLVEADAEPREVATLEIVLELERELKMRNHVYPRLVKRGKLDRVQAQRRILIIETILHDYVEKMGRSAPPMPGRE